VRAIGANSKNADANTSATNPQVVNEDVFQASYMLNNNANTYGPFIAKYPGTLGNGLKVAVCDNSSDFSTWTYKSYFTSAPGTSEYVQNAGGSADELHVVVIDSTGLFTGVAGTVLETYPFLSKASDAVVNGTTNYYKQVIFNDSNYVYAIDPPQYSTTSTTWGRMAAGTVFAVLSGAQLISFAGGTDESPVDGQTQRAWDLFANKETVDVALLLTADANIAIQQYVIDNIANVRKDCVAFISPRYADVVNQNGGESANITTWLGLLQRSSSYTVADSGWKYMYDKYNSTYRWIPLNGDVAGLCAYTDTIRDPWWSPAGLNRGNIKNAIKLAWSPSKTYRDTLYNAGVNPVCSFPGNGIVLFGDKTLQAKPSAFDRINVRRLFIVLEKSIAKAAQYSLFEFNDEFTRAQFVALVTPFLREVQGRRGITDFKVVCDTTNNTGQVIDSNQFVGDIYIKPARSINFIQLNFVAVGTGVDFTTVVGQF
jgi:phage tail sheath protein FI